MEIGMSVKYLSVVDINAEGGGAERSSGRVAEGGGIGGGRSRMIFQPATETGPFYRLGRLLPLQKVIRCITELSSNSHAISRLSLLVLLISRRLAM